MSELSKNAARDAVKAQIGQLGAGLTSIDEKITQLMPKYQSSAFKGSIGEQNVEEFLKTRFSTFDYAVERVSSVKNKSGDIIISKTARGSAIRERIMIDVKNWSNNVSKDEQEKMKRDLQEQQIKVGVLVNLQKGFANFGSLDFEVVDDGKHVIIYIGHAQNNMDVLELGVRVAFVINEVLDDSYREARDKEEIDKIIEKAREMFKLQNDFQIMKKTMEDAMAQFGKRLTEELKKMEKLTSKHDEFPPLKKQKTI